MIQRKQSMYLFISFLLTGVLILKPLAEFINIESTYILNFKGIYQLTDGMVNESAIFQTYPLLILIPLSSLLSLITIFLYKKRIAQIRLCGVNIAFQLGITGSIFYFVHIGSKTLEATSTYQYIDVFPLIAMVLTILAIISIGKDEALIRSLNRIR